MPSLDPFRMLNPVDQAEVALSACHDDFVIAREQVADNYVHARNESDARYWWEVLEVFEGKAQA